MPAPSRFDMTPREKMIEEFYLGLIARILHAKDDEAVLYRKEITYLADRVLELRGQLDTFRSTVARNSKAKRR